MCVNVFLADDSEIMREAIRRRLSDRKDIAVIGEASNFRETIQKTAELHPDLILLDVHLAERAGERFVERCENSSDYVGCR
jgi:DNA-binding NarL/FixJ family response regulator